MSATVSQQLRRRRAASQRLPVLDCGRSDPWHYPPPRRGYRQASHHLLGVGLCPSPDIEQLRTMWRAGGADRQTAKRIADVWELTG